MVKYFCDICENEIEDNKVRLGALEFTNKVIHLCPDCRSKFKEAKEAIHTEYEAKYTVLDEDYIEDLKDEILTPENENVDPAPIFE